MTLPTLCSSPLDALMLEWQGLVSEFEWPKENMEDDIKNIVAFLEYIKGLQKAKSDLDSVLTRIQETTRKQDDEDKLAVKISEILVRYTSRLATIASAKHLMMIVKNPNGKWDINKMGRNFKPVAHAIKALASVDVEKGSLATVELEDLCGQLSIFETCCSLLDDPLWKDDALKRFFDIGEGFKANFTKQVNDNFQTFDQSIIGDLKEFVKVYTPVLKAAESWAMEPVMWAFEGDKTKQDFKNLNSNLANLKNFLKGLNTFAAHTTSQDDLSKLISKAKTYIKEANAMETLSCEIAGVLMCATYFLSNDESESFDMKNVVKYAQDNYVMKVASLPKKLSTMVSEELKKVPGGQENSDHAASASSKAKRDKKEKEKKKEKGDKGDKKDKKDKKDGKKKK